ncbi:hypothetical protein LDO51_09260 [Providencia alcalifaciens]|nr:hypothetical protein LDO51_09260 [Providencia alcalifaciens]
MACVGTCCPEAGWRKVGVSPWISQPAQPGRAFSSDPIPVSVQIDRKRRERRPRLLGRAAMRGGTADQIIGMRHWLRRVDPPDDTGSEQQRLQPAHMGIDIAS